MAIVKYYLSFQEHDETEHVKSLKVEKSFPLILSIEHEFTTFKLYGSSIFLCSKGRLDVHDIPKTCVTIDGKQKTRPRLCRGLVSLGSLVFFFNHRRVGGTLF